MQSQSRVRTGRILLVLVGLALILDAFHVISLPWPMLWPVILLVGGIAMIRWVVRPGTDGPARRPEPSIAKPEKADRSVVLKIARAMVGLFVKS